MNFEKKPVWEPYKTYTNDKKMHSEAYNMDCMTSKVMKSNKTCIGPYINECDSTKINCE